MSGAKKRAPKRRFKEFLNAGDWEQRKLSDITEIVMGQSPSSKNYTDNPNDNILVQGNADLKDGKVVPRLWTKEITKTIDKDGIILTVRAPVGDVARTDYKVVLGRGVAGIKGNDYIYQFLQKLQNNRYWVSLSSGSTFESINSNDIKDLFIDIPSIEEQTKISMLLNNVNSIITLHQRKLDKLQATKKALLQEMFPEEGQDKPKRRFKGFTDAWEQRKLGECMNSFAYGLNAAAKEYDGMHKYIRITDIDDETHNFIQSNLTSPDIDFNMDVSNYKLNVGDIVFARTGASVGKTYLYNPNDGDLYYAGFLIRGKVKEDCDAGFIYQNTLTKDYDSFIKITSQRSGQPGVNSKEYATFRLNIPCKDEQEKISKVLNSLDELFTLHQRKLDKLKNLKQAYLNEMFV